MAEPRRGLNGNGVPPAPLPSPSSSQPQPQPQPPDPDPDPAPAQSPYPVTPPPPPPPSVLLSPAAEQPQPAPALEGRDRRVARVELVVMLFVAAVPGLVLGLSGISDPQTVDTDVDLITLIAGIAAAFGPAMLAVFLLWRDGHLLRAGFGRPQPRSLLASSAAAFGLTVAASIVAAMVLNGILALFGAELTSPERSDIEVTGAYLVVAFIISTTAGISEEIVYRAYAITRMEQAGWPRAAAFVPLLVWTGQHLYQGWAGPVIVGAVGVPLVIMFRTKRSVWPLIVGHLAYDVLIFVISASTSN